MDKVDQALRLGIRAQPVALYNADCIAGMASNIPDNSIDMIFTDPPYGIKGETLDVMYNRDDSLVIKGYVDVSLENYADWSLSWIKQCERVLRPGGSMYIVSGYTNLHHILNALHSTSLNEVNHLIAHYSFGVYTKKKWVSSHYHVLFWEKPETKVLKRTFNTHCLFSDTQQSYLDRLSVQKLPRHYKSGEIRNSNQLSVEFIDKYIQYSSSINDVILDPFGGSYSTGFSAIGLGRRFIGFELNPFAHDHFGTKLMQECRSAKEKEDDIAHSGGQRSDYHGWNDGGIGDLVLP